MPIGRSSMPARGRPAHQPCRTLEGCLPSRSRSRPWPSPRWPAFFHFVRVGRNEIDERDEAAAHKLPTPHRSAPACNHRTSAHEDNERRATVERYSSGEATKFTGWSPSLFLLAALSGLALFIPPSSGSADLFGGGPWTRNPAPVHRTIHDGRVPAPRCDRLGRQPHASAAAMAAATVRTW